MYERILLQSLQKDILLVDNLVKSLQNTQEYFFLFLNIYIYKYFSWSITLKFLSKYLSLSGLS